jgi:virginiamycin B lyase
MRHNWHGDSVNADSASIVTGHTRGSRSLAVAVLLPLLLAACRHGRAAAPPATQTPHGVSAVRAASPRSSNAVGVGSPVGAPPEPGVPRTPMATPSMGKLSAADSQLISNLWRGGYVIYLRALPAEPGQPAAFDEPSDCTTAALTAQSDTQQAQLRAIGVALHELSIPLGDVLSGDDCQARVTAQLMFGEATDSDELADLDGVTADERAARLSALRRRLTSAPQENVNTVLVGQQVNLRDAVNVNLTSAGEAAIFQPDGAGGFTLVARLLPERWPQLADQLLGERLQEYPVPPGTHPHDVAPAPDGTLWYTAQATGKLGQLDPATGATHEIALGDGSAPHGVIIGPDGAPWVTDGGLNAIVRVDPGSEEVTRYPLPADYPAASLNTAVFDADGQLWFTGNAGVYGRLDPASGVMQIFESPRGAGPYGITATADAVYFASLQGNYLGRVAPAGGAVTLLDPPSAGQGARRAWADSSGRVWVSEWNAGNVAVYDPATETWREWPLPEAGAQPYAVYVDDHDGVWLTDFAHNALVRFNPASETFQAFPFPTEHASVRQLLGRPGEIWGAESATDKLVVLRGT